MHVLNITPVWKQLPSLSIPCQVLLHIRENVKLLYSKINIGGYEHSFMNLNACTDSCPHLYNQIINCSSTIDASSDSFPTLKDHLTYSLSGSFCILRVSYEWDHTECNLWRMAFVFVMNLMYLRSIQVMLAHSLLTFTHVRSSFTGWASACACAHTKQFAVFSTQSDNGQLFNECSCAVRWCKTGS